MWIIKLNIKRKLCTATPYHLNPVLQIVGIYAAVHSGSRALKVPYIRSVLYIYLTCAFQSCTTTIEQAWTNYRHLQVYQSKCLRVLGDFPRRTPISNLHAHLQMIPIRQFIYHLTDKFFMSCPAHPNPLIRNTGNYTLEDLHRQYIKYRHKCIKHILL